MREYYVYILRCNDGKYYTGVTNNLEERVLQHQRGMNPKSFTYKRRPVELVYYENFGEISDAIAREKQLQPWSRKKKEALIRGDFDELRLAAKKKCK